MPNPVRKFFASLIILFSITFVFYFFNNLAYVLSEPYLEDLIIDRVFYSTLKSALTYFPGNLIGAILMTYGFWVKVGELPVDYDGSLSGKKTLSQMLIPILMAILLFSLGQYFFLPGLSRIEQNLDLRSTLSLQILEKAQRLNRQIEESLTREKSELEKKEMGENKTGELLEELHLNLIQLTALVPTNDSYIRWMFTVRSNIEERAFIERLRAQTGPLRPRYRLLELTEREVFDLAKKAFENEDFEAANELAYQAAWSLHLKDPKDQGRRELARDTKNLLEESWKKIEELRLSMEAQRQRSFFYRKNFTFGLWEAGQVREAYYGFLALEREFPQDSDVQRYLAEARKAMEEILIFNQDMETQFSLQMDDLSDLKDSSKVVFKVKNDDGLFILLGFEGIIANSQGVFFREVEIRATDDSGATLYHLWAPFGRWKNYSLQLETRDAYEFHDQLLPRDLRRAPGIENQYPIVPKDQIPFRGSYEIELPYSPSTLLFLAEKGQYLPSFAELWTNTTQLEEMGHSPLPYQVAFMEKLFSPFFLFAITYFTIFLARKLRSKYLGYPPWQLIAALVFLPIVLHFAWTLVMWMLKLSMAYLILYLGLGITIPLLLSAILGAAFFFIYQAYAIFLPRN